MQGCIIIYCLECLANGEFREQQVTKQRLQNCTHRASAFLQVKFHYCADDMANFPFKYKID